MRRFKRLTLKGFPFFKDQSFQLDQHPLVVITGLNLDGAPRGRAALSGFNSNFTGKSLFFSQLRDLFFPGGANGTAKDKIRRGEVTLELDVGSTSFEITRVGKGRSDRYRILKNGESWTPKAAVDQAQRVARILGMSQDAYEVTYYLDHLKPHVLRTGTSASRKAFFTDFFDLYAADLAKQKVSQERLRIRRDTAVLVELKEQFGKMEVGDVGPLEIQREAYEKKARRYESLLDELRRSRMLHEFRTRFEESLELCEARGLKGPKSIQAFIDRVSGQIKEIGTILDTSRQHAVYVQSLKDYRVSVKRRNEWLSGHGFADESEVDESREKHRGQRAKIEARLGQAQDTATSASKRLSQKEAQLEVAREALESVRAQLTALKRKGPSGTCSLCGQPVTNAHFDKEVSALKADGRECSSKVERLSAEVTSLGEESKIAADQVDEIKFKLRKKDELLADLDSMPEVLERPTPPEVEPPSDEEVAELEERRHKMRSAIAALQPLLDEGVEDQLRIHFKNPDDTYSNDEWDAVNTALTKTQVKLATIEERIRAATEAAATYEDLKARIAELEASVADAEPANILYRAFASNDGVKAIQIKALCSALESQVNKLARELYPSPYTFHFDLDKQFTIDVTRRVGKTDETSDVRKLSGAEAGLFDLMLAVSLMSFIPESKRCNLLILDELDSNFGPSVTNSFVQFLHKLTKDIPNIVVITPRETNYGEDAAYYTVARKNGVSRILPGRLRNLKVKEKA